MSILQQRVSTIRSQLVPVDVEIDVFYQRLITFLLNLLEAPKQQDQQLEIEVKLGQYLPRDPNDRIILETLRLFRRISTYNHTILNEVGPIYMFAPCFTFKPWTELIFDSTTNPQPFQYLSQYLRKVSKATTNYHDTRIKDFYIDPNHEQMIAPAQTSLRLDLHFQSGERSSITYNGQKILCETIKKSRLDDLDIMKGIAQFRVTGQLEKSIQVSENGEEIIQRIYKGDPIRTVRFKSITSLIYQFFRVDISRVLQLNPEQVCSSIGNVSWKALLLSLLRALHDVDEPGRMDPNIRIRETRRKTECEIEVIDLPYVKQYPEACIKRIIRNADSFYQIERVHKELLVSKIQERHPTVSYREWEPPVIGSYQQKVYRKNHKFRHV